MLSLWSTSGEVDVPFFTQKAYWLVESICRDVCLHYLNFKQLYAPLVKEPSFANNKEKSINL